MNNINLTAFGLRVRLAVAAMGLVLCCALVLLVAGAVTLAWLLAQPALQAERHQAAMRAATMSAPVVASLVPVTANDNLQLFYATLGEKRHVEQQVKTLFALADKTGLSLRQGEYKGAYDRNARVHTYQVTLPVKGSYDKVWQFAMLGLASMPFASLDEINFKRETIGEPAVEARMRLTLYLGDGTTGAVR